MTLKTLHNWDVIPDMNDPRLDLFDIPGVPGRRMRLRKDVGPYLIAFATRYHKRIARLNRGTFDDWSWSALRKGRAATQSTRYSDHCGGVAIDLNATREGSQSSSSLKFWRNPIKATRLRILRRRFRLLEWGGDYSKFRDPMHWTFKYGVTAAQVEREMRRMKIDKRGRIH